MRTVDISITLNQNIIRNSCIDVKSYLKFVPISNISPCPAVTLSESSWTLLSVSDDCAQSECTERERERDMRLTGTKARAKTNRFRFVFLFVLRFLWYLITRSSLRTSTRGSIDSPRIHLTDQFLRFHCVNEARGLRLLLVTAQTTCSNLFTYSWYWIIFCISVAYCLIHVGYFN